MPNSFGNLDRTWPLKDSADLPRLRDWYDLDPIPELRYANSIYVSGGKWPARGWILLSLKDYAELHEELGLWANDYYLNLEDTYTGAAVTLRWLAIVQARCVSSGMEDDENAVYLIELTDRRGLLWNPWYQTPTASYYNVPAPAYPGRYYDGSLKAYAHWSWNTLVGDLWDQMQTQLGTYPGLPLAAPSLPENWNFPGVSAWLALNRVLTFLGCTVTANLLYDATGETVTAYQIANYSQTDVLFDALTEANRGLLEDDMQYIDVGAARVPGTVIVHFHRRNQYYGTEETLRLDSWQWQMRGFWTHAVAAPAIYANASGVHFLWSDFEVRYDADGNPLAADVVTATAVAEEQAADYYNSITRGTQGYMRRVYTGLVPFTTGPSVDGVCFRQDSRNRGGWRTEIVRGIDLGEWTHAK